MFNLANLASILVFCCLFSKAAAAATASLVTSRQTTALPLGANCTENSDCQSQKCWPTYWYFGQTICSPSPAGVACTDDTDCISGRCTIDGICNKNSPTNPTNNDLCYTDADCYGANCMAAYLGGGQNTQCFPPHVGDYCDAVTGCISSNCTDSICQSAASGHACYFEDADGCVAGDECGVISMSSPNGDCFKPNSQK